ncbi:MAG: hypothetical protein JXK93_13985 [Sphaerochaetaceae bacterium]|nr:hypothetical protein [Sphaerochaetaceae bacterium]
MRALRCVALLCLVLFAVSCTLYDEFGKEVRYTIPQGNHYSNHDFFSYIRSDTVIFRFHFDDSAIYDIGADQSDINKLFGFAEGSASAIHEWSARFGWRWYGERLEILAYAYIDGQRRSELLGVLENGASGIGCITSEDDRYRFTFESTTVEFLKSRSYSDRTKYLSYPYFGGTTPAPHDVSVWVTVLP